MRRPVLFAFLLVAPTLQGADFNVESSLSYTLPVPSEVEVRSTFSALMDQTITEHWHFVWGADYERFDFGRGLPALPDTLQTIGAHLGLEYRVDDEPVFMLQLQPGWHGGGNLDTGAFDMPVTLASGYSIVKDVEVAFGVYYSRLTRYPVLPVGGVIWKISDQLELDLLFPDSALAWTVTKADTVSAFADVLGTGFQVDDSGQHVKVEYYQTRTGLKWEHEFAPGWSTILQGGWALDRTMDFYQQQNRTVSLPTAPFLSLGFKARF